MLTSCNKDNIATNNSTKTTNYYQSDEYKYKINMRIKAQEILTEISTDINVQKEILESIKAIQKENVGRDETLYFKEFLKNNYNTILNKPSITGLKFNQIAYKLDYANHIDINNLLPGQTPNGGTSNNTLSLYLIEEDEEIYMPYHEDFTVSYNPTCTHQDLSISENTGNGTIKIGNSIKNRSINDEYAQYNACWIVGSFDDNRPINPLPIQPSTPTRITSTILDPTWIDLGYIKATDPHEGLFRGGPEFRLNATDINIFGNDATAFPTSELSINMSRKEAKNGTQKRQWIVIDQSWELAELNKRIFIYEDDRDGAPAQLLNIIFPIGVQLPVIGTITVNAGKEISNKDENLGHIPYNRATYYNSNLKNGNFGHGKDPDGWPYFYHGGSVWYSLPRLMN